MKIVNSWNDFDPLKHVIVGRADNCCIAPSEPASKAKVPLNSPMRGMTGPRPLDTVEKANAQLDNLCKILEQHGVKVDRPTPLQWNQAVVTPHFMTGSMFGCMPPRDVLLTIGNEIIAAPMSFRSRYFEYLAYSPILRKYFDEDPDFKWISAPRPELGDASYDMHYFDGDVTEEVLLERTAKLHMVTTEHEILFDAADVMRVGKDLFCQHGLTTNRKAMEWLRRQYPDFRVHAVNFPGDPYPIHIDANTDSAFWKNSLNDIGTLTTNFTFNNTDSLNVLRQMFVRYSGKGKTIQHEIQGVSYFNFKIYMLYYRYRTLNIKQ